MALDDTRTPTQEELEAPVKGYQLEAVRSTLTGKLTGIEELLKSVLEQTKGVVSFTVMQDYVEKRIDEKIEPLNVHKKNTTRLGWAVLLLVIGDIVSRIFKLL